MVWLESSRTIRRGRGITDYTDELFLHLMSKHPDEEIVSRSVFTRDRLGNMIQTSIAKATGPNLDPDLHPIFRLSDGSDVVPGFNSRSDRLRAIYKLEGDTLTIWPLSRAKSTLSRRGQTYDKTRVSAY